MRSRFKIPRRLLAGLGLVGALLALSALWQAATQATRSATGHPEALATASVYLPFVTGSDHPGTFLINGGFEQDDVGWHQYNGGGAAYWRPHDLIGSAAEGFHPYEGQYAALLGGYETSWDVLTQTVRIPLDGQLSYVWQMGTYETSIFHDHLAVDLLAPGGARVAALARHSVSEPEGVWQQQMVDLSAYGGQMLVLRFSVYNDNYYFSWFDIDQVHLGPAP